MDLRSTSGDDHGTRVPKGGTDMAGDVDPVRRECVAMFGNPKDVCVRTEVVVRECGEVCGWVAGVSAACRSGRSAAVTVPVRPEGGWRRALRVSSDGSVVNPRQEDVGAIGGSVGHACAT
jgi:hypothetical protein